MNKYLEDLKDNMIDAIGYQINKWLADGVTITREVIDNTIDQYYDDVTGNSYGATPNRIFTCDAEAFYTTNADACELLEWLEGTGSVGLIAKCYAEGDYNTLDVLESCRVYEANRDAIVDAVCNYYKINK